MTTFEKMKNIKNFFFDVDGVFTDGTFLVQQNGDLLRSMSAHDGQALRFAANAGFGVYIITGGNSMGVKIRFERLGAHEVHLAAKNKLEIFKDICTRNAIDASTCLYMGDDIPDISVMKEVLLPCCPVNAAPEVRAVSDYISLKKGGDRCVREMIENVMKVQEKWPV